MLAQEISSIAVSIKVVVACKMVELQLVNRWYNIFCTKKYAYIKLFLLFIFII
jgi:hypothetical protein